MDAQPPEPPGVPSEAGHTECKNVQIPIGFEGAKQCIQMMSTHYPTQVFFARPSEGSAYGFRQVLINNPELRLFAGRMEPSTALEIGNETLTEMIKVWHTYCKLICCEIKNIYKSEIHWRGIQIAGYFDIAVIPKDAM